MNTIVGKNIRILRENAGYTQNGLAHYLGVDQSFIAKIEKGDRGASAEMLEKLAALFGISEDQLESAVLEEGPRLSFAFRGKELSVDEMEAVAAINRIALNSELLDSVLGDALR